VVTAPDAVSTRKGPGLGRPASARASSSTEHNLDLAFNSLDAQREACEAYVKSQLHEGCASYRSISLTAASLGPRWTLQALLAQVRVRKIDIVLGLQGRPADPLAR
jgi:hypothetical protein